MLDKPLLDRPLKDNESMCGRQVEMTISATGDIVDAYDTYINIHVYGDKHRSGKQKSVHVVVFARLVFWRTTHKKIVLGTVRPLGVENGRYPAYLLDAIKRIAAPVEIKDYWKKSFEKYVVVAIGKMFKSPEGLECLDHIWRHSDTSGKVREKPSYINNVLAYTCPLASWEAIKRQTLAECQDGEGLDHKCYEGPHGFVRSDNADDFTILPVSSFPVTELIV